MEEGGLVDTGIRAPLTAGLSQPRNGFRVHRHTYKAISIPRALKHYSMSLTRRIDPIRRQNPILPNQSRLVEIHPLSPHDVRDFLGTLLVQPCARVAVINVRLDIERLARETRVHLVRKGRKA